MLLHLSLLYFLLVPASANSYGFKTRSWEDSYGLADAIVSKMTIDEKLNVIIGSGQFNGNRRCVGDTTAIPRLGIPSICYQDGPAGLRLVKNVTGFPTGINTASTFSRRLMRARGVAIGEEYRGKGAHVYLGPAMDIMRNPKAGRGWESFGPDSYLNGEAAYETIIGVQSVGVQACAKHFLSNNQEHWRYGLSANVDDRTMHEIYFYPFVRSIEADVVSVMCAYNRFNDTSSCHNANLIGPNGILRKNGFRGYVVSDWGATHDSAADNANAGLDMEQPGDYLVIGGGVYHDNALKNAVKDGQVTEARLDEMVARILAGWYHLGQDSGFPPVNFDTQKSDGSGPRNEHVNVRSAAHTALVREIAAASTVLLKNNRQSSSLHPENEATMITKGLPVILGEAKTVAIIGQDAKLPNLHCNELNECNDGTMSIGWGSGSNLLDFIVPPITALTDHIGTTSQITTSLSNDIHAAVKAARGKDLAFVFANAMSGELGTYTYVYGNLGDRNDIQLWWDTASLIAHVASVCPNTIAVIHSVGPVDMSPFADHPNVTAIVYAGAPGEQTGPGLVDVLYGKYNPSGRLPFSIADKEGDYGTTIVTESVPHTDSKDQNLLGMLVNPFGLMVNPFEPDIPYTEKLLIDYKYMDHAGHVPRFQFGFGLSYTTFSYSSLLISDLESGDFAVDFMITNTGGVAGAEIPQMYLGFPVEAGEPRRLLRGFDEVPLGVGESRDVRMSLGKRDMSIWDTPSQQYIRLPGHYTVWIGASISDVRLSGTVAI